MELDGRIGTNGLGESDCHRSSGSNAFGAVGIFGNGRKGVPRPRSPRSSYARRHMKTIGLLVVLAAIAVVSAGAMLPLSKGSAAQQELPDKILSRPPGMPYAVFGWTYDTVTNGTPLGFCDVTVTNKNTGESATTQSDADGYYMMTDINEPTLYPTGGVNGDIINVTAVKGAYVGWVEGVYDDTIFAFIWMDVALTDIGVIPEFPMVIVPVIGMVALVAVVSLRRRSREL